ncbi:hypothetical protein DVH24_002246 [Malus domestica]|uniref:Uncharacterized protein n=1 Tax=Malus domestica TaxID=3750 RepID=A0A498I4R0_MALDO|nr:hypothetical protein DVH24_002246 [Malus domestica]
MHNLAEITIGESVDSAATSLQHIGESSSLIPISISTNRLLPSLVQVPNRIHNAIPSTIFEDMFIRKERRKHHHNHVLVEIQRTIIKVP